MKDNRGWHFEPYRHSLAARGIPTQHIFHGDRVRAPLTDEEKNYENWLSNPWLQENYPNYEDYKKWKANNATSKYQSYKDPQGRTAHDKIFEMVRENTGSNMLDSGGAYGYTYNTPIAEDGLIWSDYLGYSISLPHFLDAFFSFDENTDKFNEILDGLIESDQNGSYFEDATEALDLIRNYADDKNVDFSKQEIFNTYNFENDLDQVFQGQTFEYNGEKYIVIMTHNGCDVRGGYSRPHIFQVDGDDYYFSTMHLQYWASGPCYGEEPDRKTHQMDIEGKKIPERRDYEPEWDSAHEYTSAWESSKIKDKPLKSDDWENLRKPDGYELRCPECGDYHIVVYNPGTHGY